MMEARSPRQIQEKFTDLYQTALIANWKVWPAAQVSSFHLSFFFHLSRSDMFAVYQFPLYTSCVPCPVLASLWSFLDVVSVHFKLRVG